MSSLPVAPASAPRLIDGRGRALTYLRLSITDRCNLRCRYCMPGSPEFAPREQLLSLDEQVRLVRCMSDMGVRKVRLTGGEPLVCPHVVELCQRIHEVPGVQELVITTNGVLLPRLAAPLRNAGVRRINISLDSLQPGRFHDLTRGGSLQRTLDGIAAARAAGFERIRLNSVVLGRYNLDEALDLVRFAREQQLDISFIEEMPFSDTPTWTRPGESPLLEARQAIDAVFPLVPSTVSSGGPSHYFQSAGSDIRIGFITPSSPNFCTHCNRIRITATGRLLLCLGQKDGIALRPLLQEHPDDDSELRTHILEAIAHKPAGHAFDQPALTHRRPRMHQTGG